MLAHWRVFACWKYVCVLTTWLHMFVMLVHLRMSVTNAHIFSLNKGVCMFCFHMFLRTLIYERAASFDFFIHSLVSIFWIVFACVWILCMMSSSLTSNVFFIYWCAILHDICVCACTLAFILMSLLFKEVMTLKTMVCLCYLCVLWFWERHASENDNVPSDYRINIITNP